MTRSAIASATIFPGYAPQTVEYAGNTTQEVFITANDTRECMLASEKALSALWMTPEEDLAWKDL